MQQLNHVGSSHLPTTESRFGGGETPGNLTYSASAVSDVSPQTGYINTESRDGDARSTQSNRFVDIIPNIEQPKIESKDHMWKPAPIMGRNFTAREVSEPEITGQTSAAITGQAIGYRAALRSEQ